MLPDQNLTVIELLSTPAPGTVRLVNGTGPHEGRVEIFYNGTWGTVCDNHWSLKDGLVVCRQLGYPGVLQTYKQAHFGEGTGPILFDNLQCNGNEGNLTQCPSGDVNCDHSEDAGVTCDRESVAPTSTTKKLTASTSALPSIASMLSSTPVLVEPSSIPVEPTPAPGTVRLVNGAGPHEGRVEIFYNGTWGTVCDNHWSLKDGLVVCHQLGYPGVLRTHRQAHFGEGTGPILFDNLQCNGDEGNLTQCPSGDVNCDHSEDAGVTCDRESVAPTSTTKKLTASTSALPSIASMLSSTPVLVEPSSIPVEPTPAPGTVRLVNGAGPHEGRVEIFYNGTWGTVCDNHWSWKDGLVVCHQLGYPGVLRTHRQAHFGEGIGPILFDNLQCNGDEGNLTQCPSGYVNCDHSEDAGVTCAGLTMVSVSPSSVTKESTASETVEGPSFSSVTGPSSTLPPSSFLTSSDQLVDHPPPTVGKGVQWGGMDTGCLACRDIDAYIFMGIRAIPVDTIYCIYL